MKDRAHEGEEAREQLTKLQLAEAHAKVNDSEKGKTIRQMVQEQSPAPQAPPAPPVWLVQGPPWAAWGGHGDPVRRRLATGAIIVGTLDSG